MKEYPQDEHTEKARQFWAKVKSVPQQELKRQVLALVKQEKIKANREL